MVDTPSPMGLLLGAECMDVRGYRPVPLTASGGQLRGYVDRFWPEGKTIRFTGEITDGLILAESIRAGWMMPVMRLTGERDWRRVGAMYLPDWELQGVELVPEQAHGERSLWDACCVELDDDPPARPRPANPYLLP
jgi:hypothetical protein